MPGTGLPSTRTVLGALDAELQAANREVRDRAVQALRAETPRGRTGGLAGAVQGREGRTATGRQVTVGFGRSVRHGATTAAAVARWVNRGTGVRRVGPGPKRPIRAKARGGSLILPGGRRVRSVKGQAANPFLARARPRIVADAERQLEQVPDRAVDAIARTIGRGGA